MPPNSPDERHHQHQRVGGKADQADQRGEDAGKGETESGDGGVTGGARCQHAADQHAERAHQQGAGQRHIGQRVGRSVKRGERDDEEVVEPAHERNQDEKAEVEEDRRRQQQPPAGVVAGPLCGAGVRGAVSARRSAGVGRCAMRSASTAKPRIAAPT